MTSKYYAILTSQGAARLANATMLGSKLNLTQMAVGDANGILPTPDPTQTRLINQKRIAPLNMLDIDPSNPGQIIAEQIIPENEGGFWIREIGLYDDEGILIAVANCPETYKPRLQEGSGRTQTIRMLLIVSNTESVTLKIDPSVVLATRKYVDDRMSGASLQLDKLIEKHINAEDPHTQYAHKESPAFSGTPTAPTADKADNSNKLATTKFVKGAIADLQSKLDNNQPVDCYTKAESDTRYPDSGSVAYLTKSTIQRFQGSIEVRDIFSIYTLNDVNGLRLEPGLKNNIGLKRRGKWTYYSFPDKDGELALKSDLTSLLDGLDIYPVGAPLPWPLATPPSGYLICNGQRFNPSTYPGLASAYPGGVLPDLRGEFIRGWDNGRGVDTGRRILTQQFGNTPVMDYEYPVGSGFSVTIRAVGNDEGANETRPRNIAFLYIVRAK